MIRGGRGMTRLTKALFLYLVEKDVKSTTVFLKLRFVWIRITCFRRTGYVILQSGMGFAT